MVHSARGSTASASAPEPKKTSPITAAGASYPFDPAADGLAAIYVTRILERGIDPRVLCAEIRADRFGIIDRGAARRALVARSRTTRFGRGTAPHLHARSAAHLTRPDHVVRNVRRRSPTSLSRKIVAAGLAMLLLLPLGVIVANAQEAPAQARYIVQPGDTLEAVAAEFGVDPAAILAASAVQHPPALTAAEIIVIPDPGESPEAAAWNASQREGASPFVSGAHDVAPGETMADIAAAYGLDPWALAMFNGIADLDTVIAGQRLRIPLTDTVAVGAAAPAWGESVSGPVFAADVPAYYQAYPLSCEYAAAFIATSGLGWGVPESAFVERIGYSANPHWGYRGDIYGAWGGTDDYGVYPEALVPTLNEFGYVTDVFYGGDAAAITSRIDAGMPVLTWLGYFGDTAWVQEDEGAYLLAPGMHVVTVYGYDDWGVYVSNPGRGIYDHYAWGDFLAMWSVLDGMALAVAPM